MSADNVGIEAAKVCGRGSGGDSSKSLVLCPPTVETAEELEGSFSLPSGSAKATPQATEAASCSQASAVSGAATNGVGSRERFCVPGLETPKEEEKLLQAVMTRIRKELQEKIALVKRLKTSDALVVGVQLRRPSSKGVDVVVFDLNETEKVDETIKKVELKKDVAAMIMEDTRASAEIAVQVEELSSRVKGNSRQIQSLWDHVAKPVSKPARKPETKNARKNRSRSSRRFALNPNAQPFWPAAFLVASNEHGRKKVLSSRKAPRRRKEKAKNNNNDVTFCMMMRASTPVARRTRSSSAHSGRQSARGGLRRSSRRETGRSEWISPEVVVQETKDASVADDEDDLSLGLFDEAKEKKHAAQPEEKKQGGAATLPEEKNRPHPVVRRQAAMESLFAPRQEVPVPDDDVKLELASTQQDLNALRIAHRVAQQQATAFSQRADRTIAEIKDEVARATRHLDEQAARLQQQQQNAERNAAVERKLLLVLGDEMRDMLQDGVAAITARAREVAEQNLPRRGPLLGDDGKNPFAALMSEHIDGDPLVDNDDKGDDKDDKPRDDVDKNDEDDRSTKKANRRSRRRRGRKSKKAVRMMDSGDDSSPPSSGDESTDSSVTESSSDSLASIDGEGGADRKHGRRTRRRRTDDVAFRKMLPKPKPFTRSEGEPWEEWLHKFKDFARGLRSKKKVRLLRSYMGPDALGTYELCLRRDRNITWTRLCRRLTRTFSDSKAIEMNRFWVLKKKPTESMKQFVLRFEKKVTALRGDRPTERTLIHRFLRALGNTRLRRDLAKRKFKSLRRLQKAAEEDAEVDKVYGSDSEDEPIKRTKKKVSRVNFKGDDSEENEDQLLHTHDERRLLVRQALVKQQQPEPWKKTLPEQMRSLRDQNASRAKEMQELRAHSSRLGATLASVMAQQERSNTEISDVLRLVRSMAEARARNDVRVTAGPANIPPVLRGLKVCEHCGKQGHTRETCWLLRPELREEWLKKHPNRRRGGARGGAAQQQPQQPQQLQQQQQLAAESQSLETVITQGSVVEEKERDCNLRTSLAWGASSSCRMMRSSPVLDETKQLCPHGKAIVQTDIELGPNCKVKVPLFNGCRACVWKIHEELQKHDPAETANLEAEEEELKADAKALPDVENEAVTVDDESQAAVESESDRGRRSGLRGDQHNQRWKKGPEGVEEKRR
jgi:hypothetical protein